MDELLAFEEEHKHDSDMVKKCRSFRFLVSDFNKKELSLEEEKRRLYERLEEISSKTPAYRNALVIEYHGLLICDENHENVLYPEGVFPINENAQKQLAEIEKIYEQLEEIDRQSSLDGIDEIEKPRLK